MPGLQWLRKIDGIRSRLVVLALIGVLPFVWYRIADIQNSHAGAIAALREQAIRAASGAATQQSEVFAEVKTLLGVIARVPAATSADHDECATFLSSVKEGRYWAKSLFVTDATGEIVCSTDPNAIGIKVGDRAYFAEARDKRQFTVSDFIFSRMDNQPIIVNAFPTYGPDGTLKAMIAATMKLFTFNLAVAEVGKRLGAQVLVFDANGEVLARFPTDAAANDAVPAANLATTMDESGQGWFEAQDSDGVRRLYGVSVLPGTHARLAAGFSIEGELAAVERMLTTAYFTAAAVTLATLLLALLAGEFSFIRQLRAILTATRRLAEGDLSARASVGTSAVEFRELATSFNTMADRLGTLATSDSLTGVANRRRFETYLAGEWRRALRSRTSIALAIIDIDGFKLFNDRYGHQVGDLCLKLVAQELSLFARRSQDLLGRYGGEEFIVGMPDMTETEAFVHCERMRAAVEALPFGELNLAAGSITISIGVAVVQPEPGTTIDLLIAMADSALYAAKESGRNRVALHRAAGTPPEARLA